MQEETREFIEKLQDSLQPKPMNSYAFYGFGIFLLLTNGMPKDSIIRLLVKVTGSSLYFVYLSRMFLLSRKQKQSFMKSMEEYFELRIPDRILLYPSPPVYTIFGKLPKIEWSRYLSPALADAVASGVQLPGPNQVQLSNLFAKGDGEFYWFDGRESIPPNVLKLLDLQQELDSEARYKLLMALDRQDNPAFKGEIQRILEKFPSKRERKTVTH